MGSTAPAAELALGSFRIADSKSQIANYPAYGLRTHLLLAIGYWLFGTSLRRIPLGRRCHWLQRSTKTAFSEAYGYPPRNRKRSIQHYQIVPLEDSVGNGPVSLIG